LQASSTEHAPWQHPELRPTFVGMHAQAFVQYKTAAANSLTDWAFVRAQYRDTVLPTAGVLRQFEELFRQHNVVVMGHSLDLGSAVAAHVQGLLYSNAQYLVALCEVCPSLFVMLQM